MDDNFMTRIWIEGKPFPAPRPRFDSIRKIAYNNKDYTNIKKKIGLIIKSRIKKPLECPIYLKLDFFYKVPKSWSKKKKENAKWKESRPDIDNLQKTVFDALNGIAYKDDSQIVMVQARKQYGQKEGTIIEIQSLD